MTGLERVPIIDWNDMAIEFLPTSHRTPRFIAWVQSLLQGSSGWLNKNFWNYCYGDIVSNFYNDSFSYVINDTSIMYDGVYISTYSGNIGNTPNSNKIYDSSLTYVTGNCVIFGGTFENPNFWIAKQDISIPEIFTESHWTQLSGYVWYKIAPYYVGAQERCQYSSQKMVMEYALNRIFRTEYRNPTSITTGGYLPLSDIYITTVAFQNASWGVGTEGQIFGSVGTKPGIYGWGTTSTTLADTTYQFIINIPVSLSVALGTSYEKIIRNFVDGINMIGTTYTISTY